MNALGATILFVTCALVCFASRRWAMIGTMIGVFYLTYSQNVMIAGFNIFPYRVIETVGFIRVMVRKEFSFRALNKIDWAVIVLQVFTTVVFVARSNRDQFNQIGVALDALLCYFMFRGLIGGIGATDRRDAAIASIAIATDVTRNAPATVQSAIRRVPWTESAKPLMISAGQTM